MIDAINNGKSSWKRTDAITTRLSDIPSTVRATLWKNSVRNVLKNITDGIGYEGVIETWQRDDEYKQ